MVECMHNHIVIEKIGSITVVKNAVLLSMRDRNLFSNYTEPLNTVAWCFSNRSLIVIRQPGSRAMEERLLPLPTLTLDVIWRFWDKVAGYGSPGCWLWTGATINGYGQFCYNYGKFYSHRVAYYIQYGTDPGKELVCHECNTPHCVKGIHLFLGNSAINQQHKQDCNHGSVGSLTSQAKLTESMIPPIRKRLANCETPLMIARSLGLGRQTIEAIQQGRTWRHVP